MIKASYFKNCCTAIILYDFGDTRTNNAWVCRSGGVGTPRKEKYEVIKRQIENKIEVAGHLMITAVTNNQQKAANKALKDCGFEHSTWMSKRQHPETRIRLWWRRPDQY